MIYLYYIARERATQNTLSSFHSCGISLKTVVQGVPRFTELLSSTKTPKIVNMSIYLNESFQSLQDVRRVTLNQFKEI